MKITRRRLRQLIREALEPAVQEKINSMAPGEVTHAISVLEKPISRRSFLFGAVSLSVLAGLFGRSTIQDTDKRAELLSLLREKQQQSSVIAIPVVEIYYSGPDQIHSGDYIRGAEGGELSISIYKKQKGADKPVEEHLYSDDEGLWDDIPSILRETTKFNIPEEWLESAGRALDARASEVQREYEDVDIDSIDDDGRVDISMTLMSDGTWHYHIVN